MAQLVEHNLAKVGVAGSNPVVRSKKIREMSETQPKVFEIVRLREEVMETLIRLLFRIRAEAGDFRPHEQRSGPPVLSS